MDGWKKILSFWGPAKPGRCVCFFFFFCFRAFQGGVFLPSIWRMESWCVLGSINSHYFHIICRGWSSTQFRRGLYTHEIRIPSLKVGGLPSPRTKELIDPGSCVCRKRNTTEPAWERIHLPLEKEHYLQNDRLGMASCELFVFFGS